MFKIFFFYVALRLVSFSELNFLVHMSLNMLFFRIHANQIYTTVSLYGWSDATKFQASPTAILREGGLTSQAGRVREVVCVWISVFP
jgi:hypothetical protein